MEIRMLQSIAGGDFCLSPGDVTDRFSDAECIRFFEAGIAVPVSETKVERAVKRAPEKRKGR